MFEKWRKRSEVKPAEQQKTNTSKLEGTIHGVMSSGRVFDIIASELVRKKADQFPSKDAVREFLSGVRDAQQALRAARIIDGTIGKGTFRKLSFLSRDADAEKNVFRILKRDVEGVSFEKQAEKGFYLGIMENYGIQWALEKAARDAWQNFFDANGHTLDGITSRVETDEEAKKARIVISGSQTYDWRELVHIGATTKKDSKRSAGGFGEGTKDLALVLLRDFGAEEVVYSADDWELNFYLDFVPEETYSKKTKGLYIRKKKIEPREGNFLRVAFSGERAQESANAVVKARELFFSSENQDFIGSSYDNPATGGFKILPPLAARYGMVEKKKGNFYQAGQRLHFDNREEWETVENVNLWTWEKILPKDRDRGMVTHQEILKIVVPLVIDSMTTDDMKKSVYDFKPVWEHTRGYEVSSDLLERIVDRLAEQNIILEFGQEYVADDMPFVFWIKDGLKQKGHKICGGYMNKIGMKKLSERFKELSNHMRVEGTAEEIRRIDIIKRAAKKIGLAEDEIKDIWLFGAESEKSIIHGEYNPLFYWIAREVVNGDFLHALQIYFHEAAHKKGKHGDAQFDYYLQEMLGKIQLFILNERQEFEKFGKEWNNLLE